jgi:hypothetical protein
LPGLKKMTLNLMLTSRNAVYLSADFRITSPCHTHTDNRNTQKLIPVIRFGWGALIAYTGIAEAPRPFLDTGDWVSAQVDTIPMDGSFEELPKRLLSADDWMIKGAPLAFSIVGFIGRRPFIMLISNFLNLNGQITGVRPSLDIFQSKPKHPEVRIAGYGNAVRIEDKKNLNLLLRQNTNRQVMRENLAQVNDRASQRSSLISKECVTGYILPSGAVELGPHGIGDREEYLPNFVIREFMKNGVIGFSTKYDTYGNPLPPRWVGMTAKIQGGRSKDAIVAVIHVIRNVGTPLRNGMERKGQTIFWKIAEKNERPPTFTFSRNKK